LVSSSPWLFWRWRLGSSGKPLGTGGFGGGQRGSTRRSELSRIAPTRQLRENLTPSLGSGSLRKHSSACGGHANPVPTVVPQHKTFSFEADHVIRRELAADSQNVRNLRRRSILEAIQHGPDPEPRFAITPMLPEQFISLPLERVPGDVVAGSALPLLRIHDPLSDQNLQMVMRRADADVRRPRDRTKVVSREEKEVLVDPMPRLVVEGSDAGGCHSHHVRVATVGCSRIPSSGGLDRTEAKRSDSSRSDWPETDNGAMRTITD